MDRGAFQASLRGRKYILIVFKMPSWNSMKMKRLSYAPKAKLLNVVLLGLNLIVRKSMLFNNFFQSDFSYKK